MVAVSMRWRQLALRTISDHHERIEREQAEKQRTIGDFARAANTTELATRIRHARERRSKSPPATE